MASDVAQGVVLLVGEHSREADIESHFDVGQGVFKGSAEGVHHAEQWAVAVFLAEAREHFIVAISRVDDQG